MNLNLIDQLTLLALDDEKGSFVVDSTSFYYALAGAVIMELALQTRIDLSGDKIVVRDKTLTGDTIIDRYFELIMKSEKDRKVKHWIQQIGHKASKIRRDTIEKLIDDRILTKEENKILWVFTYNKYPAQNSRPENLLRSRLNDIIVHSHRPELKEIMLLNLIQSCNLQKEVFGKEQAKTFKRKIKTINEYDDLAGAVNKSVKEICEAINAMLVIMVATTVVATSS